MSRKKEVFQPDDRFFKQAMGDRAVARRYLQHFCPDIAALADLESLELQDGNLLRPNLKLFRADVVYRCRFKSEERSHFYFSLLFEHKSEPDEHIAIQVGLYIMLILRQMSLRDKQKLEPVIPLVFYNGKSDWQPKSIPELFAESPYFDQIKPYHPDFRFLFTNVSKVAPEELLKLELSYFRSAMLSMGLRHRPQLILQYITAILEGLKGERMEAVMTFTLAVMERSPAQFMEALENLTFTTKPEAMSTLEMLKEEGRQEGRHKGRQEGRQWERVLHLLKTAAKFPQMEASELAEFTNLPLTAIQGFQQQLSSGNPEAVMQYLEKELLGHMTLEAEERYTLKQAVAAVLPLRQ